MVVKNIDEQPWFKKRVLLLEETTNLIKESSPVFIWYDNFKRFSTPMYFIDKLYKSFFSDILPHDSLKWVNLWMSFRILLVVSELVRMKEQSSGGEGNSFHKTSIYLNIFLQLSFVYIICLTRQSIIRHGLI